MKTIINNFLAVLKTYITSSAINILGLSVALVVFFIVMMQVHFDFTYDKNYANSDKILQLNIFKEKNGETQVMSNFKIPTTISEKYPEIEKYCLCAMWGADMLNVNNGDMSREAFSISHIRTTSGFFDVFNPEIITGDITDIFSSPGKVMISEKTAKRLFGNDNPIGKTLRSNFSNENYSIQAIYRDFPENSSMKNGIYSYLREFGESEWSFNAYFSVRKDSHSSINDKLTETIWGEEQIKHMEEHPEDRMQIRLSTMNDLYLNSAGKGGSKRINTTVTLLSIGILTILIAFVNFINLSMSMAPSRVRGINIRKVLGISKVKLQTTIAMESVLFTLVSIMISFGGIHLLNGTAFVNEIFAVDLALSSNIWLLTGTSIVILIISFGIGLYTMRYSTSFDEAIALKGSFALGIQGVKLRNILIIFQFTTAIALICGSTFIKQQNDYMLNYDWGFAKENIIYMPLYRLGNNSQSFGQELLRNPQVSDYTITRFLPGQVGMSWGRNFEGKKINMKVWTVDERFFDFFDIKIVAGIKPEHADTLVSQLVFNEAFLTEYDFDETIVGKDFDAFGPGRIQAIAKDINFESLHEKIKPMAFGVLSQWQQFNFFLVKLSGNDIKESMNYVKTTWEKYSKEPFETRFLDEEMDRLYQTESNMAKLIAMLGFVVVLIAVMGVYGLIVFNTKYKSKEIAIRKVNGSTVSEIMFLLNRSILIQLAIAFAIATPIAWYAISKWLENFAYKTTLHWWIFPLSGLVVLIITIITVSAQSYKAATTNPNNTLNKG